MTKAVNDYHQENDEMFNILIYNLLYKTKQKLFILILGIFSNFIM